MSERRWSRIAILTLIGLVCLGTNACLSQEGVVGVTHWPATAEPSPSPTPPATATPSRSLPTATGIPVPTATPKSEAEPMPLDAPDRLNITILYDNNPYDERLKTAWGFSCLVERGDLTLLFDAGGDAQTLLSNMAILGLDPAAIDIVVLSHIHGDHVGGLGGILAANQGIAVYVPRSFPASLKGQVKRSAHLVEVREPTEIAAGVYSTGEMGSGIREQSLALVTKQGLVVITGCAHPGIVEIVAKAKEITGEEVYLAMGGFHLSGAGQGRIKSIIEEFRRLGVQRVAPCHCSGDLARRSFKASYGEACILAGVGSRLQVPEQATVSECD